ncbi:MAG: hypothetical protein ACRYFK_18990 [Janthinobacterium lividum]
MPRPDAPSYRETQWFGRRWWWLLLLLLAAASWIGYSSPQYNLKSRVVLALPALLVLALVVGLGLLRLQVRLDAEGVHYRYFPLLWRWRHWPWAEFRQVYARHYSPLGDYGGWGLRGLSGNKAYNVWGSEGLQLVFKSGNRLLLGTQRPAELRAALRGLKTALPTLPIKAPAAS